MKKPNFRKLSVVIGKRQIMLAGMTLVLGTAVYVNYAMSSGSSIKAADKVDTKSVNYGDAQLVAAAETDSEDYFAQARIDRTTSRDEAIETLQTIMNGGDSSPEEQEAASEEAATMTGLIEKESKIENLVKAAGFSDCVVYLDGENANIVVKSDGGLIESEAAQIKDILLSEVDVANENIRIYDVE
ncbi:MAG: SpoIIIAH-like family protein [Ruminococcus sp.]|nr:SpoIIIAH-like family protein [Ruminococcus sp.]